MKIVRSQRKDVYDPFVILSEMQWSTYIATLHNLSATGALFAIQGKLEIKDKIIACPIDSLDYSELPTIDEIKNHPDRLEGIVVRTEEPDRFGIRFHHRAQVKNDSFDRKESVSCKTDDNLLYSTVSLQGNPSVSQFVRFHDMIRERAQESLFVTIDLSEVKKVSSICIPMLRELLEKIVREKRTIAVVNGAAMGKNFAEDYLPSLGIENFSSLDEANSLIEKKTLTVLLVEDDEVTLELLKQLFSNMGFKTIPVTNSEEALEILSTRSVDLVLMDIHLPGMDGIAASKKIREHRQTKHVPIIILTGEANREFVQATIALGLNGYILKPLNKEVLKKKVLAALSS